MAKVASEYEVESIFIEKLGEMGYDFIPMSNYNDIVNNLFILPLRRPAPIRRAAIYSYGWGISVKC